MESMFKYRIEITMSFSGTILLNINFGFGDLPSPLMDIFHLCYVIPSLSIVS